MQMKPLLMHITACFYTRGVSLQLYYYLLVITKYAVKKLFSIIIVLS